MISVVLDRNILIQPFSSASDWDVGQAEISKRYLDRQFDSSTVNIVILSDWDV